MGQQNLTSRITDTVLSERVIRRPVYFGSEEAPVFGWLHMPRDYSTIRHGVVICPPLGVDYVNTYPVIRWLSDRLAAEGIPVMRFDYSGTGNSCGFGTDPDRVEHWLNDIRMARQALSRMGGCEHVGLLGVRIGALLAATVAHETELPFLMLWGAMSRGRAYMREMRAMQALQIPAGEGQQGAQPEGGEIEAGGFIFTEQTSRDLSNLNLADLKPKAKHIFIADRDDLPNNAALEQAWMQENVNVVQKELPGFAGMLIAPQEYDFKVPYLAIDELVQWVSAVPTHGGQSTHPQSPEADHEALFRGVPQSDEATVCETPIRFGPRGEHFGIATYPRGRLNPDTPWFVLLNSGALHTAGPNRLYVILVRALASAGIPCFRFDFSNVGDSVINPLENENRLYEKTNSEEIASALTVLTHERGARSFVLLGLCSGAYASFHGGLELSEWPIVESILFNPLRFYWNEDSVLGDIYQVAEDKREEIAQHNTWKYYMGAVKNKQRWKSLLVGKADIWQVFLALMRRLQRFRREFHNRFAPIDAIAGGNADPLAQDIRRFIESGRRLTFVFSRADPGHALLMSHAGPVVRRYLRANKIRIWFIERADHTFTRKAVREQFIQSVVAYVLRSYRR